MSDPATPEEWSAIVLYGKPGCHLCDEAKPLVARVAAECNLPIQVVNILDNPELCSSYRYRIPVVRHAGEVLDEGRVTVARLRARAAQVAPRRPT